MEEEKQRIADELRHAEEEANQLEEEVQRIGNTPSHSISLNSFSIRIVYTFSQRQYSPPVLISSLTLLFMHGSIRIKESGRRRA